MQGNRPKIAILGACGIGGYYGRLLARSGGDVTSFTISPNSGRVAYRADQQTDDVVQPSVSYDVSKANLPMIRKKTRRIR